MLAITRLCAFLASIAATTALECHPQGALVPRPRNLTHSKAFQDVLSNLTSTLEAAVNGDIKSGWDIRNVSISLGLVSLDQAAPDVPLWEFNHLGSGNVNGTKDISRHSQYIIGSLSKVVSDAILIKSDVSLDDPVSKYIPSLGNSTSLISWDNITLRALGSQLSGATPNYGFSEYYYLKDFFEALGFPHLNDSAYGDCGIIGLNRGCTKEQLLEGMLRVHPIAPPMTRPVYSNIAFTIVAYALQAQTGKDYITLLEDTITKPLNMVNTVATPGNDSIAVIPPVENSWGSNYGDNAPGGGLVSTLADMSSFMHAILDRSIFDTETKVREWLQPRDFAGSPNSLVGMPWEIFRPPPGLVFPQYNETSGEGGHHVTVFAKDGAAYGYGAKFAVLEEYGVGLVLLTAGDASARFTVYDALLTTLIPALDAAAREETENNYVGTFLGNSTSETGKVPVNATMALDGHSLKLTSLNRNGTDMLESLQQVWSATLSLVVPAIQSTGLWRIYPAEVLTRGVWGGKDVILEDWRIWFDVDLVVDTDLPGKGVGANDCLSWAFVDWIYYGSEPVDRLVFIKDAVTNEVLGVDVPFLRTGTMAKAGPL